MPKSIIFFNKAPASGRDPDREYIEKQLSDPKLPEKYKQKIREALAKTSPAPTDPNKKLIEDFIAENPNSDTEIYYNGTKMN